MRLYKLTDSDGRGHDGTAWSNGATRRIQKSLQGYQLCTNNVFHAYRDDQLALLVNDVHAAHDQPRLWVAEAPEIVVEEDAMVGVWELSIIGEKPLPWWYNTVEQRCLAGMLACAAYVEELSISDPERPNDALGIVRHGLDAAGTFEKYRKLMYSRAHYADDWATTLLGLELERRAGLDISFDIATFLVYLSNAYTTRSGGYHLNHSGLIGSALAPLFPLT